MCAINNLVSAPNNLPDSLPESVAVDYPSGKIPTNFESIDHQSEGTSTDEADELVSADGLVDIEGCFHETDVRDRVRSAVRDFEHNLVGIREMKSKIREIGAYSIVQSLKQRLAFKSVESVGLHFSLTGRPGTGKTICGTRIGATLNRMGLIEKGKTALVTREDLLGKYIGTTAPKVKKILIANTGGTVFLDEAYYFYRLGNKTDFGHEIIEVLLQHMENHRDSLVVILAGYAQKMRAFYSANPGICSRIPHHVNFPDFGLDDLNTILHLILLEKQYCIDREAEAALMKHIENEMRRPTFGNARSLENMVNYLSFIQGHRIFSTTGVLTTRDLITFKEEDVVKLVLWDEAQAETVALKQKQKATHSQPQHSSDRYHAADAELR